MDLTGRKLGKYDVIERLGRGGMADVYKAFQPGVERHVAIKVMHSHLADSEDFIARFRREAQSIGRLQHANIVRVIDLDIEADVYYMVMDFIQGGTLQDYLKENSPLSIDEAIQITLQLADALAYAHNQNMVHRDIKPGNVMFMDEGHSHAVLTDFGIAHLLDDQFTKLTMTGASVGTPSYMSPEIARGEACDGRTDIYSLGVMLFEMVAGRTPYVAETPFSLMMKQANEPIPSPQTYNPNVPKAIEPILEKAMAKVPAERYQSAKEFGDALRGLLASLDNESASDIGVVQTVPIRNTKEANDPAVRKRNRGLLLAGGGVLLVTLLTTILLLSIGPNDLANPTELPAVMDATHAADVAAAPPATTLPTPTMVSDIAPLSDTNADSGEKGTTDLEESISTDTASVDTTVLTDNLPISTTIDGATGVISSMVVDEAITVPVTITDSVELTPTSIISTPTDAVASAVLDVPNHKGTLRFITNAEGTREFRLYLHGVDQPPVNSQYALWLKGNDDATLYLTSIVPQNGVVILESTLEGAVTDGPLTKYHTALIGLEPVENNGLSLPETVVYSSTLATEQLLLPLHMLLHENPLDEDALGLLAAAQGQLELAVSHGGFLQDALAADDMVEGHRHAEHLINILDGETGDYYGDLDRDGAVQNPGNGVGLLVYMDEVDTQFASLAITVPASRYVAHGQATLKQLITLAIAAKEKAAQIIAADTVTEAQPKADELMAMLTRLHIDTDWDQDGTIDPLYEKDGLNALLLPTEQLLTYHFGDSGNTLQVAARAPLGSLRFYKDESGNAKADTAASDYSGNYGGGNNSSTPGVMQSAIPIYAETFYLFVDGLFAPPVDHHYELWLTTSDSVETDISLGTVEFALESGSLQGESPIDALTTYERAMIVTVADGTTEVSERISSAERPAALTKFLQNVLVQRDETRAALVHGAIQQLTIAVLHTGFLQDELEKKDLTEARRHAEHVRNILIGKEGEYFGDIDGSGLPENPGDGIGVLVYLDEIESQLTALLADGALPTTIRATAEDALLLLQKNRDLIVQAEETTLRVFAADSAAEVQSFEDEVKELLNNALHGIDREGNTVIARDATEGGINALVDLVIAMSGYTFE